MPHGIRGKALTGFIFALPAVVLFLVFFVAPFVMMLWVSLHHWPLLGKVRFVGLANFGRVFHDPQFWQATIFTVKYAILVVPSLFVAGLALALLLQKPTRSNGIVRTAAFLPVSLGYAAASYLWLSLLNPRVGIVDRALMDLGLVGSAINWFDTATKGLLVVLFISLWKFAGFPMVAFIGGLNAIPTDVVEAAAIDGAGPVRTFFMIKAPLLKRTAAFVLTFSIVTAFLTFDQFYILTAGGPQNGTITLVYWIYNVSFIKADLGWGSAMSVVFLCLLGAVTAVQLYLLRDREGETW